jgi:hypothetical protein
MESITGLRAALEAIIAGSGTPLSDADPTPVSVLGSSSPGTGLGVARDDHQHSIPEATETTKGIVNLGPGGAAPYDPSGSTIGDVAADLGDHIAKTTDAHGGIVGNARTGAAQRLGVWSGDQYMGGSARAEYESGGDAVLEPWNDFTLDNVETDHYGRGTISKSAGWLWTAAWGEPMGGYWLRNDHSVGGDRTVTITYGATIGGGDCGFSVKLFLGQPAGTPKRTLNFPLGRFRIFQDQDTLYVYNAAGTTIWSRALPTASDPEEYVTIAVTAFGSAAAVYQNEVLVATGDATAGTGTGVTVTFAEWAWPNQYRTCGFCELVVWDRLPTIDELSSARQRERPAAPPSGSDTLRLLAGAELQIIDHSAATHRLQRAEPDGTLTPIAEAVWTPGAPGTDDGTAGAAWAELALNPAGGSLTGVASNGADVIVAVSSATGYSVYRSTDEGDNWTMYDLWTPSPSAPGFYQCYSVCWTGTEFIMVGNSGTGGGFCAASTDGITWAMRNTSLSPNSFDGIAAGSGLLVAVSGGTGNAYVSTDDGVTWNSYSHGVTSGLAVIHSDGRFFVSGNAGVSWSDDGITWNPTTSGALAAHSNWYGVAANGNNIVVTGYGAETAVSSDNGATWGAGANLPSGAYPNAFAVVFSGGFFCVLGVSESTRSDDNGASWEAPALVSGTNARKACITAENIIAVGGGSVPAVFRTSNGGVPGTRSLLTLGADVDLDVDGLVHANTLQVDALAGTDVRLVGAGADGTQEALPNPGTEGDYGAASKTLTATVDLQGRVEAIAAVPIQIAQSQVTNLRSDLVAKQPSRGSFGGYPRRALAIPANQHRVTHLAFSLGV